MTAKDLRQKFIDFFISKGHKQIASAPLVPENDPTVLFTTAGMHPLVPYLLGEPHPQGQRLVDAQKCLRTTDIDEVGDKTHLTFFEMLGNWSIGYTSSEKLNNKSSKSVAPAYWKQESIRWSYEFLTKKEWLNIPKDKLAVSVFAGDKNAPRDEESAKLWQELGVAKERIAYLGKQDNWWGPAGQTGPCGPDTEMFYWSGQQPAPKKFAPQDKNWIEIWNNVFMQYNQKADASFEPLAQKNVDTGLGLERTAAILNGLDDVFAIDAFNSLRQSLEKISGQKYGTDKTKTKSLRIIMDHIRASVFILTEGVEPSNKDRGYILRRLIRRAIRHGYLLGIEQAFISKLAQAVIKQYSQDYPELAENSKNILNQLEIEESKFVITITRGLKEFDKYYQKGAAGFVSNSQNYKELAEKAFQSPKILPGLVVFRLFSTYGFPLELIQEIARDRGLTVDLAGYQQEMAEHQELSRTAAAGKFKGGLADAGEQAKKLHTAAHLLLSALRQVLGESVEQRGANINAERLRFDFSHAAKLTDAQKQKVEDLVNQAIAAKIPIKCEQMPLAKAKTIGATGIFDSKYGARVKVYTMGQVSQEICGGPHVENTEELGRFQIIKEESSSAGVRRIKAVLI